MTTETFIERHGPTPDRAEMDMLVEKAEDASDQLFVFFPQDEKVGSNKVTWRYCGFYSFTARVALDV